MMGLFSLLQKMEKAHEHSAFISCAISVSWGYTPHVPLSSLRLLVSSLIIYCILPYSSSSPISPVLLTIASLVLPLSTHQLRTSSLPLSHLPIYLVPHSYLRPTLLCTLALFQGSPPKFSAMSKVPVDNLKPTPFSPASYLYIPCPSLPLLFPTPFLSIFFILPFS